MIFRAIAGFTGVQGMFMSVKYLPVSIAGCIFHTIPIWSALLAYIFINETLQIYDIISIFTAFVGVLIINNPWSDQADQQQQLESGSFIDTKVYTTRDTIIGTTFCIVGAIGASSAFLCMRIMRGDIHFSISPFWFSIGCTFLSPIFSASQMSQQEMTTTYTWEMGTIIAAASITSFLAQVTQSRAY